MLNFFPNKSLFCVFAGAWNKVIARLDLKQSIKFLIYKLPIKNGLNERKTGALKSSDTLLVPNNNIRIRNLSFN